MSLCSNSHQKVKSISPPLQAGLTCDWLRPPECGRCDVCQLWAKDSRDIVSLPCLGLMLPCEHTQVTLLQDEGLMRQPPWSLQRKPAASRHMSEAMLDHSVSPSQVTTETWVSQWRLAKPSPPWSAELPSLISKTHAFCFKPLSLGWFGEYSGNS